MNIIDYIKKYGKCDYETLPFNDVDRLILSQLSYLKFEGLLPEVGENKESVSIGQVANMPDVDLLFADERYAKNNRAFFEALAEYPRFSLIRLNYFIDLKDEKWELQFAAMTAFLPNDFVYIVYRGTDESILGWKEDLNMTFMTPIPAQEKAVDYINYVASCVPGDFSVGGHSKGGNLAVYAAMMCSTDIEARIVGVYSHDGPGFTKNILDGADFNRIKSKVHKLVPHSSIVGMLLTTMEDYEVVMCRNFGILQHDPFNWIVEGTDFVKKHEVRKGMMVRNDAINKWAEKLTDEECRELSDDLYDVFVAAGIDNLNDFYKNPAQATKKFLDAAENLDEDRKQISKDIVLLLMECLVAEAKSDFEMRREETVAQLENFKDETVAQFENLKEETVTQLENLKEETKSQIEKIFHKSADESVNELTDESANESANESTDEAKEQSDTEEVSELDKKDKRNT